MTRTLRLLSRAFAAAAVLAPAAPALAGEVQLLPAEAAPGDEIGSAVAIHGDTAVVGAPLSDLAGLDAGAVFVFERQGGAWVQQATLLSPAPADHEVFGISVAIHGDRILVGAPRATLYSLLPGSVYSFVRSSGAWAPEARLLPGDPTSRDAFGASVALFGERCFVGCPRKAFAGVPEIGAVYSFLRTGGVWGQQQKILHQDINNYDRFGATVAFDGATLIAGSTGDDVMGTDAGAAYVFHQNGNHWLQHAKLMPAPGSDFQRYGSHVAVAGDVVAVGKATYVQQPLTVDVFERTSFPGPWVHVVALSAGDGHLGDGFGSVALDGMTLLVGARGWSMTGAAYVFARTSAGWTQIHKMVASHGAANDQFGSAVALDGTHLVIGANLADPAGTDSGAAYAFPTFPLEVTEHCPGDPTHPCPCGNHSASGGCANSTASGAALSASGSTSLALDDLVLTASAMPAFQASVLVVGAATAGPAPLGDGLLCVAPPIARFAPLNTGTAGTAAWGPGLGAHSAAMFPPGGHFLPGTSWHFQTWYRDGSGPCGGGGNLTSALEVLFGP